MSDYFQRLVQQSDLRLQAGPLATPVRSAAAPSPGPALPTASTDDLVEIHEEQIADAPHRTEELTSPATSAAPRTPAETVAPIAIAAEPARSSAAPEIPSTSSVPPSEAKAPITIVDSSPATPPPLAPSVEIGESIAIERTASPMSAPAKPPVPPSQAEVMQAVMKWIAAGSAEPSTPDQKRDAAAPAKPIAVKQESVLPPAPPTLSPAREKIPERVIKLVEAQAMPAREAAPTVAARPITPASPRATTPSPEMPVRVSIGSIQVNVEAPAPAPKPPRAARTTDSNRPASRVSRSSTTSQLRRHYIIPH